jgi:hypothetical protein
VSGAIPADDAGVRLTSGGRWLVALAVLAVGSFPVSAFAKPDPAHANTPPGQAKKVDQPAAPQTTTTTADPAPDPAPAPTTDKPTAKAQRRAAKDNAAPQAAAQQSTTTTTKQATKQQAKGQRKSSTAQTSTTTTSPSRKASTPAATKSAAPAPAASPSTTAQAAAPTAPVTTSGTFTPAKKKSRHKARKHRAAATTTRRRTARTVSAPATTATIAPTTAAEATSGTKAHKDGASGFTPTPAKADDKPNVVFRTVRDAVEVIPTTIWILLGLLTALACLFAVTSARQTRRAHRLAAERGTLLGDVGVLQEAVLPIVPPRVGALALSVAHRPAGGPAAGGDFYDVVALDDGRTALVVGDVSGHGSGALGQATLVRFTLRAHLESGAGPREALAIAADSLAPHFDEGFATAAVAIHDPNAGTLTYSTAAHEAPIVVGPGGHEPVLVASTPPLGIGAGGPSARRQTIVPFPKQSLACMLTDGALEARVRGELVGRARVQEWVRELGERPAAGDMAELIRSRAAVSDDLAVCFATSTAGEDTGEWRIEELYRPTPEEAERFLDALGATDEHKRATAEALRFRREDTVLRVRLEGGVVVSADVERNNSPKPVAA